MERSTGGTAERSVPRAEISLLDQALKPLVKEFRTTPDVQVAAQISRPAERPATTPAPPAPRQAATSGWVGPDAWAEVAGRKIGGLVYMGPAPRGGPANQPLRGNIDPSLPVAKVGTDREGTDLAYWPDYATITPRSRASYLEWLESGRVDPDVGIGYVFLYFYGLERRFFLDDPGSDERQILIAEVQRLLDLYGGSYSVRNYLGRFLDAGRAVMGGETSVGMAPEHFIGALPLSLQVGLGQMLARGETLGPDHLLAWWMHHPETSFRTAVRRVFPELRAMFRYLFNRRFPNGLKVNLPRKKLRPSYQAASGQFTRDLTEAFGDVRDFSTTRKPLEIAEEIVEEACTALGRFSRLVGKDQAARATLAGHLALPAELREEFPNEAARGLEDWLGAVADGGDLVQQGELLARMDRAGTAAPSKRDLVEAKAALATLGFGLAPDPEHGIRRPKGEESLAIYRLPEERLSLGVVGPAHGVVQLSVLLGSFIAHADGAALSHEQEALASLIEAAPDLTAGERAHLHASLLWALAVPPDLSLLTRRVKDATPDAKRELGRLSMIVATADGTIDPREVVAIERLHKALGLDPAGIYAELHALAGASELVTVKRADPELDGRRIPAPPPAPAEVKPRIGLDRDRISAVMADTAHVSSILGGIFEEASPEPAAPAIEPDPVEAASGLQGLDPIYQPFLADLLGRDHWPEADFAALADRHRLMAGGTVEALNEWAFERFDTPLLEEHDGYEIDPGLAERLRT